MHHFLRQFSLLLNESFKIWRHLDMSRNLVTLVTHVTVLDPKFLSTALVVWSPN